MSKNVKLIVYSVSDVVKAKLLFGKFLGVEPYVDSAYYVGFKAENLEVGLIPKTNNQNADSPIAYVDVEDIKESIKILTDAGATVLQDPKEVGGGLLVASVKDSDNNILGLRQQKK